MTQMSSWPSRNTQRCFRRLHASQGRPKRLDLSVAVADFGGDGAVVVVVEVRGGDVMIGETMELRMKPPSQVGCRTRDKRGSWKVEKWCQQISKECVLLYLCTSSNVK